MLSGSAFVVPLDREGLPDALAGGRAWERSSHRPLPEIADTRLLPQQVVIGRWRNDKGDPSPDFMIVRDEDLGDTFAWISAYLGGLSPVTQWCRIWSVSRVRDMPNAAPYPSLGTRLGPWVGAILAECAAQARMQLNLRTLSGTLALSSASFAAARAQAVWGAFPHFVELARRHDELSERLWARLRPIPARRLLSLWHALAGSGWAGREPAEARTLGLFRDLFDLEWEDGLPATERAGQTVSRVTDVFDLPDLAACITGPQRTRVEALDRLGERLREGPKSPAIDAILGFGASLIEPGAAVMPDLLRRFETAMPTAPVWAGAFAGLWAPVRVMTEYQGLGRLTGKALLRDNDLFAKPVADIGYEELVRWLPTISSDRMPIVRGMTARAVEVELLPGVTAPFQLRAEAGRPATSSMQPVASPARQRALQLEDGETPRSGAATPSPGELAALVDALAQRVAALETNGAGARRGGGARKPKP